MTITETLTERIDTLCGEIEPRVIAWRRDFHANPELSNREFLTGRKVAEHLASLGIEIRTEVAHTGVVGILNGGHSGKVVALRADMDALPVSEEVDVPFASRVKTNYEGQEVGVMHACGHDAHTAILMGVAEVLSRIRDHIHGTIKFIFQPAEEGAPYGEEGGASLMIKEGVLEDPTPDAIFGLHVLAGIETGKIGYRPGATLASSDTVRVEITGRQTHGAIPWRGIDPVVVASQIVLGMQTIVSRQIDLTREPVVVTFSCINGGVRSNIIPDTVTLLGTMRTFDETMRQDVRERIQNTAEMIAKSAGACACVHIEKDYDVTFNDEALTAKMIPTLERVTGAGHTFVTPKIMGTEDFSAYQKVVPGLFYLIGITPPGVTDPAPNHSPRFFVDEAGLLLGVRSLAHLAIDFLSV